jgi:hypothetical protein
MPEPVVDPTIDAVSAPLELDVVEVVPDEPLVPAELHPVAPDIPPPSNEAFELVFGHGIASGLNPG